MTSSLRHDQLREVLGHVKEGRRAISEGNLPRAVRRLRDAAARLSFARGLHAMNVDPGATATLGALVEDLEWRLERAVTPAPKADPGDLAAMVAAGIRVLNSRDGRGLPQGHITERANNIVAALAMSYDIRELSYVHGSGLPARELSTTELAECLANGEAP